MRSNTPLLSSIDESKAPWNEVEEKKTVRKKISVVLTKEIEVEVNANTETSNQEILRDYIKEYDDPCVYLHCYQLKVEQDRDATIRLCLPSLQKVFDKDLQGIRGWETETIEIDDAE